MHNKKTEKNNRYGNHYEQLNDSEARREMVLNSNARFDNNSDIIKANITPIVSGPQTRKTRYNTTEFPHPFARPGFQNPSSFFPLGRRTSIRVSIYLTNYKSLSLKM